MNVNRSLYMKLYKLLLKYTYPLILVNSANNRIFRHNSDNYWIETGGLAIFYGGMGNFAITMPITYAIARYHEPLTKQEVTILYLIYALMWIPLIYLLHRRNRIKPLFNRMKTCPIDEVKTLRKSYTWQFMLYYIIPAILGLISFLFFH